MRIAISSESGCGNTTVTKLVSERLGYPMINFTFRQLAAEKGIDFWTLSRMAETDHSIDKELDRRQTEMAMAADNCVLGSRLAIWMLEKADLKVYLTATPQTRAQRIFKREGGSFEERFKETVERDKANTRRYMDIYGIDNTKPEAVADIIIDTDDRTPDEIASIIIEEAGKRS